MSLHSWLQNLQSALTPGRTQRDHRRRASRRAATHRLNLEVLEDRCVPTFLPPVDYTVGAGPFDVKTADFNGDGIPDLATANAYIHTVSVLLSNGDGTFQPARDTGLITGPNSLAVGDYNEDGRLDLATADGNSNGNSITILLGQGDGTFLQGPIPLAYSRTDSLVAGDLNGDGRLDLVTTSVVWIDDSLDSTSVNVYLGHGDGTFAFDRAYGPYAGNLYGVLDAQKLADFDGDGNADVVATDVGYGSGTFIFRGKGDGTLQEPSAFDPGTDLWTMADFNADGLPDHAHIDSLDQRFLAVSLGNGDGSFGPTIWTPVGPYPLSFAVADFNADSRPDAAVTNFDPRQVTVLFNDGVWDGPPPVPSITIDDVTVTEGNAGTRAATFSVALSLPSNEPVTVEYATADGIATAGSDYQASSGTLTVAPGQTNKTITVLVNGDRLVEPSETLFVNLSNPANATIANGQAMGTILDDEPRIQINDVTVTEGNTGTRPGTFTVRLSGPYDVPVTIGYATANGTATAAGDYLATSGTLTFAPGETTKNITVLVNGDRLGESNETFYVNLSNPNYGLIADPQGVGVIVDDEPRISISDVSQKEGNGKKTTLFTFTVTLSAAYDQPVTMSFQTVNGTATTGDNDYVAKTGTLTFAPGETTKTITIEVKGDTKKETNETFYLDLFGLSGNALFTKNRGVGTILNDD
jgi:hypothetical protein